MRQDQTVQKMPKGKNINNKLTTPGVDSVFVIVFIIIVLLFVLSGCETTGSNRENKAAAGQDEDVGVLMLFSERERAGTELFKSRMFVNSKYLYINDDRSPEDFLLFDRKKRTIFSVTPSNETIFVIKPKEIKGDPPIKITYQGNSQPSSAIPKVSGRTATHYRYDANGEHCYDAVTLEKSFLPDVVQAIKEYRTVLAGEHASTVHKMPIDTQNACELAVNIYYATKHLDTGLPLREWDQKGFLKFMIDYNTKFKLDPEKIKIPEDFKRFSIDS